MNDDGDNDDGGADYCVLICDVFIENVVFYSWNQKYQCRIILNLTTD